MVTQFGGLELLTPIQFQLGKNQTGSGSLIFGTGSKSENGLYIFEQPDLDSQFQVYV